MTDQTDLTIDRAPRKGLAAKKRFTARVGRFHEYRARALMDQLAAWVEATYRDELADRASKHIYIRKLPAPIIAMIDQLRDSDVIYSAILEQFSSATVLEPMKATDELYISHYNKDFGGDHGLFTEHYDGNLRFMPVGSVVRALIYLQSDATYTVVFASSKVEKAFQSYDFGLLDFHKELHWVEGEYNPDDQQRILLKCNYLIAPKNALWLTRALLALNEGVFYVVKSAMEYSKSPRTPTQYLVGYTCNAMRLANNVSPLLPIVLVTTVFGAVGWGLRSILPL